jgi:hypothetical protein
MKKLLPTLYVAAALLLWSTVAHSQTINLSVTPPVVPAGACRQNLYTVAFSGAPSGSCFKISPHIIKDCLSSYKGNLNLKSLLL